MSTVRRRESSSGSDEAALRSGKDRECPFCHQAFTSSSLGRHLDLFIRPHHPKQPDGVHKVDEIRKIRARITRRQPKGMPKMKTNGGSDTPLTSPYLVQEVQEQTVLSSVEPPSRFVNTMDWRATGVINGVDQKPSVMPPELPSRDSPTLDEQLETGRAAELALRDLVDSIKAAQSASRDEFEEILSLSFPALCLHLLPAPRSLFSTTPFADDSSWDLSAPGQTQRVAVEKLLEKRRDTKALEHVEAAYHRWTTLTADQRAEIWMLEVLRSWTRGKRARDDLEAQLNIARQRIAHLESEYELLSRCQLPREKLLAAPTTIPVVADLPQVDAEDLIQKWRSNVRAVARPRRVRRPEVVLREQPAVSSLTSDIILNGSVHGIGGPMNRSESPRTQYHQELVRAADPG